MRLLLRRKRKPVRVKYTGARTRGYEGRPVCSVPVFVIPMLAAPHRQTVHAPDAQSTGRRLPAGLEGKNLTCARMQAHFIEAPINEARRP